LRWQQEQWLLRCIAISRASIWSFLVIIVASVSSTLIPHSSDPQRLIGIEDCSLDQITVFLARGIEAVMLASNHDRSIARSIDLPQQHQLHAVIREMKSQLDPTKSKCLFLALAGYLVRPIKAAMQTGSDLGYPSYDRRFTMES
jgi:hypothetical protein